MKVCGIPSSLLSDIGTVKILLIGVGVNLPKAFMAISEAIVEVTKEIDLDQSSVSPESMNLDGLYQFSLDVCEEPTALKFLLENSCTYLPHLNYQIIVGACIAESTSDLLEYAESFVDTVISAPYPAQPCLFAFCSNEDVKLPDCTTTIPSNPTQFDIKRRVREGFVRCLMDQLYGIQAKCDGLCPLQDDPVALTKLGSYCLIYTNPQLAATYFEKAIKTKNNTSMAASLESVKNLKSGINFEKYSGKDNLPDYLEGISTSDVLKAMDKSILSYMGECDDRTFKIIILLRLAKQYRTQIIARQLLLAAIDLMLTSKHHHRYNYRYNYRLALALLMLKEFGFNRTFLYHTNKFLQTKKPTTNFVIRAFAQSLISSADWLDMHLIPATELFFSETIHREVKNGLIRYLMKYVREIPKPERQKELLGLVPPATVLDASLILDINELQLERLRQPIERIHGKTSSVFIYSSLEKQRNEAIAAVGDQLVLSVEITNPLHVPISLSHIIVNATGGIPTPSEITIASHSTTSHSIVLRPSAVGTLEITGFTSYHDETRLEYKMAKPISLEVIPELPSLVVRKPFTEVEELLDHSTNLQSFEIVNSGHVPIALRPIKFAPAPAVLTPTSLPIKYPPAVSPSLPDTLAPGAAYEFTIEVVADKTLEALCFSIEYGTDQFVRRFEYNRPMTVVPGPNITRVEVIPFDDHDDFESDDATLIIVLENPTDSPITIESSDVRQVFVPARSFGAFLVNIKRIGLPFGREDERFESDELSREHIRKCETTAVKNLQRELSLAEKHQIWAALVLKLRIRDQLQLTWRSQCGAHGPLPFAHVPLSDREMTLLQPPSFGVAFEFRRTAEMNWEVKCIITSSSSDPVDVDAVLSFDAPGDEGGEVMIAGRERYQISTPGDFTVTVHCLPIGDLLVVGKFYVGDAYFIRRASFNLSIPIDE